MSETTTTAPSPSPAAAPTPAPASSVTAKLKTDEIVLGPGGGGMGSFFAAFAAGAGGGGIGGNKGPGTGKDSEEVSLRPQTGFMKKPFASGSDSGHGEKQSPASGAGGRNAKGGAAGGTGGAKDQKKKYVYTASYLRKFQSAGAHPPEDMAWYLNEVKPLAQDQSALPIGQFQQRKTQGGQSRGQERGQRGNAQAPQAPQSQPQEDTLPHRQSANPWLPRFQSIFSSSDPQQQYRQKAVSAVIGVLNKLTLEHFDSLSTFLVKQLKEANGSDLKEEIIQLVFDKAISEPNFSTMYASLCQKLNEYCPKWKKGDQEETFRNVLLSLCQKQFEKSIQRDSNKEDDEEQKREEREWKEKRRQEKNAGDDDATIDEDWEELRIAKIKKRNLGNVRFVGELYKKKLLNMQIIHDCISLILRKPQPYDEDIEILCNLLNTVGKALDNTKSEALVNKYFEKMTKLAQNKQYPARIRFMLLDTIELRANKWVPRKEQNAPQKIADIHAKAYEEDLMSAALGQAFYAQQQAGGLPAPASSASSTSRTTTQPNTRAGGSSTATTQKKAPKEKETKHVSVKAPPKGGNVSGGSSDSILETELNAIIEEYVNSAEIEEALLCLKQLPNPNWPSWFVFCATNLYVEKKERDRQSIAGLFEAALKENLLPSDELSKGFGKVFVTLEDLEIDVPHAVERVGELVARCARGKWLSSGAIQKELEPLPPKIKSKLQEGSR